MIVSVHIPKTAGTSLGRGLRDRFGVRLLEDYADRPLSNSAKDEARRRATRAEVWESGAELLNQYDVVHGHFIADKYEALPVQPLFCVVLRDPVDRAISHYRQWKELPNPVNVMSRKVIEESLDFAAFTALPGQANLYATFLGKIPLKRFAVVGLTEAYEQTLRLFEAVTGAAVPLRVDNVAAKEQAFGAKERSALLALQPENVRIFDEGRRRFEKLCSYYGI